MQSLSDAAELSKKALLWFIAGVIICFIIWLLYKGTIFLIAYLNPKPAVHNPFSDVAKLPPINLPESKAAFSKFEPVLDTELATPSVFPQFFNVYKMSHDPSSLLDVEKTKDVAKVFAIEAKGTQTKDGRVLFRSQNKLGLSEQLLVDARVWNFSYKTNYTSAGLELVDGLPSEDELITIANSFLNSYDAYKPDLKLSKPTLKYFYFDGSTEEQVESPAEANVVQIIFNRGTIPVSLPAIKFNDKGEPYYENEPREAEIINSEPNGLVNLRLARINNSNEAFRPESILLEMNLIYKGIEKRELKKEEKPNTYPIITGMQAWEKFLAGESTVIQGDVETFENLNIKEMTLGFYESTTEQAFLQPVVVFKGEGVAEGKTVPFKSILHAIRPNFIDDSQPAILRDEIESGGLPRDASSEATPAPEEEITPTPSPTKKPVSDEDFFGVPKKPGTSASPTPDPRNGVIIENEDGTKIYGDPGPTEVPVTGTTKTTKVTQPVG